MKLLAKAEMPQGKAVREQELIFPPVNEVHVLNVYLSCTPAAKEGQVLWMPTEVSLQRERREVSVYRTFWQTLGFAGNDVCT